MKDVIQKAQEKKYTEFEPRVKEILAQKTAQALQDKGYFDRLSIAKGENLSESESYKEFMTKKLKKYGVKGISELSKEEKRKFFDEIDKEWEGKDEND